MNAHQQPEHEPQQDARTDGLADRRPYETPRLEVYGNIRELTLGGSPGIGDSGGFPTKPRGFSRRG